MNQRALVVAAVKVHPAPQVNPEAGQLKQAEPRDKLQEPRVEAERLRIALAVPTHLAEPMVPQAAQVAMDQYRLP